MLRTACSRISTGLSVQSVLMIFIAIYSYGEGASSLIELLDAQRYYNQALTAYN